LGSIFWLNINTGTYQIIQTIRSPSEEERVRGCRPPLLRARKERRTCGTPGLRSPSRPASRRVRIFLAPLRKDYNPILPGGPSPSSDAVDESAGRRWMPAGPTSCACHMGQGRLRFGGRTCPSNAVHAWVAAVSVRQKRALTEKSDIHHWGFARVPPALLTLVHHSLRASTRLVNSRRS